MKPGRFNELTKAYANLRVAVVGDFCLDRYLEIDPARSEVSIETGLEVYNVINVRSQPGGSGTILNLASIASKLGILDRFAYSMSKGAVLTMTLSVARDYVDKGIRCNCVCPARVHTPFVDNYLAQHYPGEEAKVYDKLAAYQPIGRMGKPEEVATLVAFLCSDDAAFITGAAYDIDGGVTQLR